MNKQGRIQGGEGGIKPPYPLTNHGYPTKPPYYFERKKGRRRGEEEERRGEEEEKVGGGRRAPPRLEVWIRHW